MARMQYKLQGMQTLYVTIRTSAWRQISTGATFRTIPMEVLVSREKKQVLLQGKGMVPNKMPNRVMYNTFIPLMSWNKYYCLHSGNGDVFGGAALVELLKL